MTKKPVLQTGTGGLEGTGGPPMRLPSSAPTGYKAEPSLTGGVRGPMVPADQPADSILDQIERGRKGEANIDGTENRWWQPHLAPPTWTEIETRIRADPRAFEVFTNTGKNPTGVASVNSIPLQGEFWALCKAYEALMAQDPVTYMSPTARQINKPLALVAQHYAAFVCYYGVPNLFGA